MIAVARSAPHPLDAPLLAAAERLYLAGQWATAATIAAELGRPDDRERIERRIRALRLDGRWDYPVPGPADLSTAAGCVVAMFEILARKGPMRRIGLMAEGLTEGDIAGVERNRPAYCGFHGKPAGPTLQEVCRAYFADWKAREKIRRAERAAGTWAKAKVRAAKDAKGKQEARRLAS